MVVIGGGVSGAAAALEAKLLGLKVRLLEASVPLATLANFQVGKPIFTFPTSMVPKSSLKIEGNTKETLLGSLRKQLDAKGVVFEQKTVSHLSYARDHVLVHIEGEAEPILSKTVVVALGRSGNFRRLNVPGEDLGKVSNRLHDPNDYKGKKVLVVGGGDSACEAVITLTQAGADVHMAVRGPDLSRSKADLSEMVEKLIPGKLLFETQVKEISDDEVTLRKGDGLEFPIENDNVFTLIGREPHREFLRRSRLPIVFEWGFARWASFLTAFIAIAFIYMWKSEGSFVANYFAEKGWFPSEGTIDPKDVVEWFGYWFSYKGSGYGPFRIVGEIFSKNLHAPGFYYELLYTIVIGIFGVRRILRHRTPYITRQTLSLIAIQTVPLFLLPYLLADGDARRKRGVLKRVFETGFRL
jgi:thioredoxin reductase